MIAALLAAALAAQDSAARTDVLAFAPGGDAAVTKSFVLRHELTVQMMKIEGPEGTRVSQHGLDVHSEITLEVADSYRGIEDGRPLALQRVYRAAGLTVDQIATDAAGKKEQETWLGDTPLKMASVVFTWVPEEKEYGRHYDERENLEEYLAGLREDLDLRGLLPAKSEAGIAVGSTWSIEPAAFVDVFGAGGDVPRAYVKGGADFLAKPIASGLGGPLANVFGGQLSGEARATWKETREEAGTRLAVVELRVRLVAKRDQTDWMRRTMRTDELLDEVSIARGSIEWKFEGEGTLLWNVSAGRFEELGIRGREEVSNDIAFGSVEEPTSRQVIALAGGLVLEAKAKVD